MWFRFLIARLLLTLRLFPFPGFLLLRHSGRVFVMDGNILQAQPVAIRCECRIPGVGIPFRIYKNALFTGFTLNEYAMPAKAARIKPHLVAVIEQENLVILEAGFLKLPELLIA